MRKPATIKDIATHVGVSTSAVSAVLGGGESRHVRVSDATRTRILEAAQQLRYRPNRAAVTLRSKTTNVIGLYTPQGYLNPYIPFTSQIIGGLHLGCDRNQKDLLLHGMYQGRPVEDILAELADGRIDGLVVYTAPQDTLSEMLANSALPVVAIVDRLPGLPSVVADDASGSHLLAAHLAERGHRRVVYLSAAPPMISALHRRQAFEEAAARHGMTIVPCDPITYHDRLAEEDLGWLNLPIGERPTAAVCWNDLTAYSLLEHCRRLGLRLPDDLAVAGFDGIPPPHATPWSLTTIRAPWVQVAETAVDLLISQIDGKAIPEETALPVELITGDTT